jgi:hypothetical protein
VALELLGGFDERPAIVDGHRRWNFGGCVLAGFHRRLHHRHVAISHGVAVKTNRRSFRSHKAIEIPGPARTPPRRMPAP